MVMEMCFKYKQDTKECTKYPALQKLKIYLRDIVTNKVKTVHHSTTVWLTPSLSSLSVLGFCSVSWGNNPHPLPNAFPLPLYCLPRSSFKPSAFNNPLPKYTKTLSALPLHLFVTCFFIHLTNIPWVPTTCQALFRPRFRDTETNKIEAMPSKISSSNKGNRIMCSNPGQMRSIDEMFHQNFEKTNKKL